MAVDNTEKVKRLTTYSEMLKKRLESEVPPKYAANPKPFKQMLEIDLKKTLTTIEKLKMG